MDTPRPPVTHTLADLLHVYLTDYVPALVPETQRRYRRVYATLCAHLGTLPLTELTPLLLRAWRRELSQQYKPATVRCYLSALSGALTAAVRDYEWLDMQPMAKVPRPPKPAGRIRCLSDEERAALLAACQASDNQLLYPIVMVTLATGGRKNEVRRLRWPEVDLERGLVSFLVTKNRQPRSVPLAQTALGLLRGLAAVRWAPWVFPSVTGQRPVVFETAWRTARKRAGIVDFRFHDLRHSAASYLARSGASLADIMVILGHKNIAETMRYVHLVESHTRAVVERMGDMFLSCLLGAATATMLASVALVWG